MVTVNNVLQNTVRVVDESSATLDRIKQKSDAFAASVGAAGSKAAAGLGQMDRAAAHLARTVSSGLAGGNVDSRALLAQEELLARLASVSNAAARGTHIQGPGGLVQQLSGTFDTAGLDRMAEKVLALEIKTELLNRAGVPALKSFKSEIQDARTPAQLTLIENRMNAVAQKAGELGKAAGPVTFTGAIADLTEKMKGAASQGIGGGFLATMLSGAAFSLGFSAIMGALNGVLDLFKKLTFGSAELGLHLRSMANTALATGLTLQQMETLGAASKKLGIEVGALQFGMRTLSRIIVEHEHALTTLGVATRDATGNYRTTGAVMMDLSDVFAGMTNETERMRLATEIFGGRMGNQLLPLLLLGKKGFQDLTREGLLEGYIATKKMEQGLIGAANAQSLATLRWQGLGNQMAATVAGPMTNFFKWIGDIPQKMRTLGDQTTNLVLDFVALANAAHHGDWAGLVARDIDILAQKTRSLHEETDPATFTGLLSTHGTATSNVTHAIEELNSTSESMTQTIGKLTESVRAAGASKASIDNLALSFRGTWGDVAKLKLEVGLADDQVREVARRAPQVQALAAAFGSAWRAIEGITGGAKGNTPAEVVRNMAIEFDHLGEGTAVAKERFERLASLWSAATASLAPGDLAGKGKLVAWFEKNYRLNDTDMKRVLDEAARHADELNKVLTEHALDAAEGRGPALVRQTKRQISIETSVKRMNDTEAATKKLNEAVAYTPNLFSSMASAAAAAAQSATTALDQMADSVIAKMFGTKTAWSMIWSSMARAAVHELDKILGSELFKWLAMLILKIAAHFTPAGPIIDAPVGGVPVPALGRVRQVGGGDSVVNNITIHTYNPRDVALEYTSPSGAHRRAVTQMQYAMEH